MGKDAQAATSRDERAWVRRAQAGSASDFEALFRAHWGPAYRAAYLVVRDAAAAEDIAQEAFLAAVRALDRFDRRYRRNRYDWRDGQHRRDGRYGRDRLDGWDRRYGRNRFNWFDGQHRRDR